MFKPCATIFVKTDLFTENDHEEYARILNVPVNSFSKKYIGVLDVHEDEDEGIKLINFHYRADLVDSLDQKRESLGLSESDVLSIKAIRGVVVDTVSKKIVCKSFGYTSSIILPEISVTDEDRTYYENSKFKTWERGALIRVFSFKGKSFASSHRRISCSKSFFGKSRFFDQMLLEDQNAFPTLDSFFDESRSKDFLVHLFIVKNESLVIESTRSVIEDQVVYIKSFSLLPDNNEEMETRLMTDRIFQRNKTSSKPIKFPMLLSIDMANQILKGFSKTNINRSVSKDIDVIRSELESLNRDELLSMYNGGDSVLMENEHGVFRIVPPSNRNNTIIMGGHPNPSKVFTDAVASFYATDSTDKLPLIPIGFSRSNLNDIAEVLKKGEFVDFDKYDSSESVSVHELILTNVLFASPKHLIDDCLKAYDEFCEKFDTTYNFLWLHREELKTRILSKTTDDFAGFRSLGKKLQMYIKRNYVSCFNERPKDGYGCTKTITGTGPKSNWCSNAVIEFNKNLVIIDENKKKKHKTERVTYDLTSALHKNAIIALISNADTDCLCAILNMSEKIDKTIAAFERTRNAKAAEDTSK